VIHPALVTTCWAGIRRTRDEGSFEHPLALLALGWRVPRGEGAGRWGLTAPRKVPGERSGKPRDDAELAMP